MIDDRTRCLIPYNLMIFRVSTFNHKSGRFDVKLGFLTEKGLKRRSRDMHSYYVEESNLQVQV